MLKEERLRSTSHHVDDLFPNVKQMNECLQKARRTLFMVIAYPAYIGSPPIEAKDGS
jgi:hypothetical protein